MPIFNSSLYIKECIKSELLRYSNLLNSTIPCSVDSINEDSTINLKSLVDDRTYKNIQLITTPGYGFKLDNIKYVLYVQMKYAYDELLKSDNIENVFISPQGTYGYALPILTSSTVNNFKSNKDNDITLYNRNNTNKVCIGNEINIESSNKPISIKANNVVLKDLLSDVINALTLAATGTGNQGAPIIPNPSLNQKITELQTKLNRLLK